MSHVGTVCGTKHRGSDDSLQDSHVQSGQADDFSCIWQIREKDDIFVCLSKLVKHSKPVDDHSTAISVDILLVLVLGLFSAMKQAISRSPSSHCLA